MTPPDLVEAGWVIQPFYETTAWVARKANEFGGCEYSLPVETKHLEQLYEYIRVNKIAKLPWLEGFAWARIPP